MRDASVERHSNFFLSMWLLVVGSSRQILAGGDRLIDDSCGEGGRRHGQAIEALTATLSRGQRFTHTNLPGSLG